MAAALERRVAVVRLLEAGTAHDPIRTDPAPCHGLDPQRRQEARPASTGPDPDHTLPDPAAPAVAATIVTTGAAAAAATDEIGSGDDGVSYTVQIEAGLREMTGVLDGLTKMGRLGLTLASGLTGKVFLQRQST